MNAVIQTALRMRWVVVLMCLGIVAWGLWAYQQQPIDAYPDISSQMVQIITVYPGRAPEEVERQVRARGMIWLVGRHVAGPLEPRQIPSRYPTCFGLPRLGAHTPHPWPTEASGNQMGTIRAERNSAPARRADPRAK